MPADHKNLCESADDVGKKKNRFSHLGCTYHKFLFAHSTPRELIEKATPSPQPPTDAFQFLHPLGGPHLYDHTNNNTGKWRRTGHPTAQEGHRSGSRFAGQCDQQSSILSHHNCAESADQLLWPIPKWQAVPPPTELQVSCGGYFLSYFPGLSDLVNKCRLVRAALIAWPNSDHFNVGLD